MSRYNTQPARYNTQTGYYGGLTNNQLKNIALPDKLRCKRCNKWKVTEIGGKENFSKKQLAEVRSAIYYSGRGSQTPITVVCATCTGQQVHELHCVICDTTKGLECFAKAQRRTPDAAKCLLCMDEQLSFDPEHHTEHLNLMRGSVQAVQNAPGAECDECDSKGSDAFRYILTEEDDVVSEMCNLSMADNTTDSGYEADSGVTSSYNISDSMNTMNTSGRASSGGVQLSQASDWQTIGGTRTRKGVSSASNAGVNGSISSTNTPVPRPAVYSNKGGSAKVKAYKEPPPATFAATLQQQKKAKEAKLKAKQQNGQTSQVNNKDWESDGESSTASTEVPDEREIEIEWESDSDSE